VGGEGTTPGAGEPLYCCFGCRFAASITQAKGEQGEARWTLTRLALAVFLTMNVMVFTMALWAQEMPAAGEPPMASVLRNLFRYLSLLFALPVLPLLGGPLLENALAELRRGRLASDLLLVVGVVASYVYSVQSVLFDDGPVYFEVGCMVLVFVTLGRWLEATGKLRTTSALDGLTKLLPDSVCVCENGVETMRPRTEAAAGCVIRVAAGERVPCDGLVLRQSALVDEQIVTGESRPVTKDLGTSVYGGSLNLEGDLFLRVTATSEDGVLARMIELVRQARQTRGRYERLADRLTAWFLPLVLATALATFAIHAWLHGAQEGIRAFLAVLLIACPCALGLATPMALWAGLGRAARSGVLFRNGEVLERLAHVGALRLDKTGTLTTGRPRVVLFVTDAGAPVKEIAAVANRFSTSTTHVYGRAIQEYCDEQGLTSAAELDDVRSLPGRGMTAQRGDGEPVWLGSPCLMEEHQFRWPEALTAACQQANERGDPVTCLGWDGQVRGVFVFHEELRPEAAAAVAELRDLGLDLAILSGDASVRAGSLGARLGVPVRGGLLPEGKVRALEEARAAHGLVGMVGDGINDAPALAASGVGIALGCGADVSRDAASVCLIGDDLRLLPWAIRLASRTVRTIRGNLFWALVYNVAGVGFACTGRLNPILAALVMVLSSAFVVTNSLRLSTDHESTVADSTGGTEIPLRPLERVSA
jgi:heavy metal translocating P-type ATPase